MVVNIQSPASWKTCSKAGNYKQQLMYTRMFYEELHISPHYSHKPLNQLFLHSVFHHRSNQTLIIHSGVWSAEKKTTWSIMRLCEVCEYITIRHKEMSNTAFVEQSRSQRSVDQTSQMFCWKSFLSAEGTLSLMSPFHYF